MSEEYTTIKLSIPLIDDIELQRIDTFYNDIVSEYSKAFVKEKEQVITQRVMMNLQQENNQLKDNIKEVLDMVSTIEHNLEKYEEVGLDHFDYAFEKTRELKEYVTEILEGNNE